MRWQFGSANDSEYVAHRNAVIAKIEAWWNEFQRNLPQLNMLFAGKAKWDLPEWMHTHLHAIDPRLMWEFGPACKSPGHRLVITPESDRHLRPLTQSILKRAPQLPGWEFYSYRPAAGVPESIQTVQGRTGQDIRDFKVRIQRGEMNCIDLCYVAPGISGDDQNVLNAAFIATEALLGEERLDKWSGSVEVGGIKKTSAISSLFGKRNDEPKHLLPLERVKDTFDAVLQSILDQLPSELPLKHKDELQWSVLELRPEPSEDYPARTDLITIVSSNPELITATLTRRFYSERFTRHGEVFCYVKLDGSEGLKGSKFADRGEVEDALAEVLVQHKLGRHIGGGTGLRYSYIDLSLVDLPRGIQAIQHALQRGKVPYRSWIQFHDCELAAEWVGIYDDSPVPPMPNFDA